MRVNKHRNLGTPRSFLGALRDDVRGNTLAMMGMALIPLAGMVGGGIDISRMYIVKTRLQHACDAGALAGRKAMGGGTWSFNSYAARTSAEKFFDANYNSGAYGAGAATRTYTENAGKVSGAASAVLPMTLMRVFGRTNETLQVICDAEMRLPNTDVMFVLDTTGSMDENDGTGTTKIAGLRVAVKCFYEIVARLDTDANCVNGTPGGGTGNQVQIRFGFMPYSANVNVGKLLPTAWFADSWTYQTRAANYNTTAGTSSWVQTSSSVQSTNNISVQYVPYSSCNNQSAQDAGYNSQTGYTNTNSTNRWYDKTMTNVTNWTANNGGTCYATQTRTRYYETYQAGTPTQTFKNWNYDKLPVNIGLLKNGTEWNNSFQWPIGPSGANKTINWDGCVEERETVQTTNYSPIPSGAFDLDIDSEPTTSDDTKWKPVLPGLIHTRNNTGNGTSNWSFSATNNTTAEYGNGAGYACPTQARRMQTWPDAGAFDDYVDGLVTGGSTYHDIGLLWGARFVSPNGIFKDDNDYTPQGGEIERHIIFMTDGDTNTLVTNYTAYGIAWFDRRQTPTNTTPTVAMTDEQVDLRFAALCSRIKNATYNGKAAYTLWVISFGSVSTDTTTRLTNCATTGRYFNASNSTALQTTFKSIADQISQLRLTK